MSEDDSPKRNENETKRESTGAKWMTFSEAARVLGVSERSVQLRAKAGKIRSRKSGHAWEIHLDDIAIGTKTTVTETKPNETFGENETKNEDDSPKRNETNDVQKPLIDALQSEVAFLRAQLEQRDVAEAELRRLMMADKQELQALRQRLSLTAAQDTPESSDVASSGASGAEPEQSMARPWWRFWVRRKGQGNG